MFPQQYYQGPNVVPTIQRRQRTVNDIIPNIVTGLLGAFQLFLWIAIVILEIVSIYYDAGRGTIYAGLWCSIVFFITWISMFCYLCCGKSAGCGSYLVVQNTINLIFVIILLVFTSIFVDNPCLCYGALCYIYNWEYVFDLDHDEDHIYSCTQRTWRKVPVLKGLLACAILMLICNIVFIGIYLIISIRLYFKARFYIHTPDVMYQQQSDAVQWGGQPSYQPPNLNYSPHQYRRLNPIINIQTRSQFPSAPPSYAMTSEKF